MFHELINVMHFLCLIYQFTFFFSFTFYNCTKWSLHDSGWLKLKYIYVYMSDARYFSSPFSSRKFAYKTT